MILYFSGEVRTFRQIDHDMDPVDFQLSFLVEAFTQGPNIQSAIATVNIIIQDINDNGPTFRQTLYSFTVPELTGIGSEIGTVEADDVDSGQNGRVAYSIESGNGNGMGMCVRGWE